jgi:hypothetical protein
MHDRVLEALIEEIRVLRRQVSDLRRLESSAGHTENLLGNGGFEVAQRGNGPFTTHATYTIDSWRLAVAYGSVSLTRVASTLGTTGYSARFVYTHATNGYAQIAQYIENFADYIGKTVTFSVTLKCSVPGVARINLSEGGSQTVYSAYNATTGVERLSVTMTVSPAATQLRVAIAVGIASATVEVDDATCVLGFIPAPYVPRHPAEELARCQRYLEVLIAGGSWHVFATGEARAATRATFVIPFKVRKYATPNIIISNITSTGIQQGEGTLYSATDYVVDMANADQALVRVNVASGLSGGAVVHWMCNNSAAPTVYISAEL